MLEFCKQVLLKVSFDKDLFKKELKKMISLLKKEEVIVLQLWCITTFGHEYGPLIQESFSAL